MIRDLENKNESQRAAIAVRHMDGAKNGDGFSAERMAKELSARVGTTKSRILMAWRVWKTDPTFFGRIEAGEMTVWQAHHTVVLPKEVRRKRADQIRALADKAYRAEQIADRLGITEETVRYIARKFDIKLPDASIGRVHRIDVRRVVEETVTGLEGYAMGVQTIIGADLHIDPDAAGRMAESIRESIRPLNRLCRRLTEVSNGKTA